MATVTIIERGCRGCSLCVDVCPVDVFEQNAAKQKAEVARPKDCIGCLSCVYVCPARRPIVHWVKLGKAQLARLRAKKPAS